VLFPGPAREFAAAREQYGDVSLIPTPEFFRGLREEEELAIELRPGVTLLYELEAIGEADARGMRTVLVRVNGQMRPVEIRDRSIEAAGEQIERADPTVPGQVPAPVTGIVTLLVEPGQQVAEGDPVATLEAMKMESTITAPLSGTVERLAAVSGRRLEQGDLLLVLAPA
jgi:pyruvate carboxylase